MSQDAHADGSPTAPTTIAFCAWHGDIARDVRLIDVHEAGSGPNTAGSKFACEPCRERHGLVPLADRPVRP